MKTEKLRACDVLNWDYLVEIAEAPTEGYRQMGKALAAFAYAFTSASDEDQRDVMLMDVIRKGTTNVSNKAAGHHLGAIAKSFKSDFNLVREFAKQNGVTVTLWKLPGFFDPSSCDP